MPVRITIKKGKCQGGYHQVGATFLVDETTPEGMCIDAWSAVFPYVRTLLSGGNFSWEREKGMATIHCPDPQGITLELRRIDE
jgi:uncharacterized repeat protein (TIGR04076 family)